MKFFDPSQAAVLEDGVTHGKRFVNHQYVGFNIGGDSESKTYIHAARIGLYRLIEKGTNLGEAFNIRKEFFRLAA